MQLRKLFLVLPLIVATGLAMAQTTTPPVTTPVPQGTGEAFALKRVAKVGDTLSYKLVLKASLGGTDGTLTSKAVDTVKAFADTGYTVQQTWSDAKVEFGGNEMAGPPVDVELGYGPTNELLSMKGKELDDTMKSVLFRLFALRDFRAPAAPVKVGDTWSIENVANPATNIVGSKITYKVDGEEKLGAFDTVRVKLTGKETGTGEATSDITLWIDKKDGSVVKIDGMILKLPLPQAPIPVDAKITYTRDGV